MLKEKFVPSETLLHCETWDEEIYSVKTFIKDQLTISRNDTPNAVIKYQNIFLPSSILTKFFVYLIQINCGSIQIQADFAEIQYPVSTLILK